MAPKKTNEEEKRLDDLTYSGSVQSKSIASKKDMITEALSVLPGNKGTKQEIFNKISEMF
jgi:hypothetical protein